MLRTGPGSSPFFPCIASPAGDTEKSEIREKACLFRLGSLLGNRGKPENVLFFTRTSPD